MPRTVSPKFVRTKHDLIRMIRSGRWAVGKPFPSETELLTEFDITRPTLSRTLRDLAREGYLHRRQGQGTVVADYRKVIRAQKLPLIVTSRRWTAVGDDRHVINTILSGIETALHSTGCDLEVIPVDDYTLTDMTRRRLDELQPAAALVYLPSVFPQLVAHLTAQGCRVWGMGQPPAGLDCVYINEEACGHLATKYLLDHGRRRIALLNGPLDAYWGFAERRQGYLRALSEAGIEPDEQLIFKRTHVLESESGRAMARDLLASGVRFDGIFAVTDRKAMGAMAAIEEAGLSIPSQVGIVSMDNTLAERSTPPLTAVHLPLAEMAHIAAMRAIESTNAMPNVVSRTTIQLEPSLVDRGSAR